MNEPNPTNIPAYQRKRSLAAKARKKPSYTKTRRKTTRKPRKVTRLRFEESITQESSRLPSQNLFPDPLIATSEPDEVDEPMPEFREMKTCGTCDGYFDNIEVAVIKVSSPIRTGDRIIFEKDDGLFEQTVESMQINRKNVSLARSGSDIGIKVLMKPTVGTLVYKVI